MSENFEKQRDENVRESIPEMPVEIKKSPMEEEIGSMFRYQDKALEKREKKDRSGVLSKIKTWAAVTLVAGTSFLAMGCKGGGHPSQGSNEQQTSGFTDNEQEHVKQVLKIQKAEIKHMKEDQGYQAGEDAKNVAGEMHDGTIIQPIDNDNK